MASRSSRSGARGGRDRSIASGSRTDWPPAPAPTTSRRCSTGSAANPLHGVGRGPRTTSPRPGVRAARMVAVWGGPGPPGRTTVAVHLAVEASATRCQPAPRRRRHVVGLRRAAARARRIPVGRPRRRTRRGRRLARAARELLAGRARDPRCSAGWLAPSCGPRCGNGRGLGARRGPRRRDPWSSSTSPRRSRRTRSSSFDRVPYRRNLVTLDRAGTRPTRCCMVVAGDPIGVRRDRRPPDAVRVALPTSCRRRRGRREPRPDRRGRAQDCSSAAVRSGRGAAPVAFLPNEASFDASSGKVDRSRRGAPVAVAARAARRRRTVIGVMSATGDSRSRAVEIVERDVRELLPRRELAIAPRCRADPARRRGRRRLPRPLSLRRAPAAQRRGRRAAAPPHRRVRRTDPAARGSRGRGDLDQRAGTGVRGSPAATTSSRPSS